MFRKHIFAFFIMSGLLFSQQTGKAVDLKGTADYIHQGTKQSFFHYDPDFKEKQWVLTIQKKWESATFSRIKNRKV